MNGSTILTRQTPGSVSIDNYEEIKAYLEEDLLRYRNITYSEEHLKDAETDRTALNKLKRAPDDRRREIKKLYMEPYLKPEYLSEQFGISRPDAHRAWCDAEANAQIYRKLKQISENSSF